MHEKEIVLGLAWVSSVRLGGFDHSKREPAHCTSFLLHFMLLSAILDIHHSVEFQGKLVPFQRLGRLSRLLGGLIGRWCWSLC